MAEELWIKVLARNKIMELAETIATQFKPYKTDKLGNLARFISVKNIKFTEQYYEETIQYDVEIEFLSDVGSWIQNVLVKEFTSTYYYEREMYLYRLLEQRLFLYNTINPTTLVYEDPEAHIMVYTTGEGNLLNELNINQALMDYQFGLLSGILQGGDIVDHNYNEIYDLAKYLINSIAFTPSVKKDFNKLVENHIKLLKSSKGGYEPAVVFGKHIFRFNPIAREATKSLIAQNKAYQIDILIEQPSQRYSDRMEDVASYLAQDAMNEFLETGSIKKIQERVLLFMEGYETALKRVMFRTLSHIYPNGLPIDLHFVMNIWILYYFQVHDNSPNTSYKEFEIIEFSNYLLRERPFQSSFPFPNQSRSVLKSYE